MPGSRELHAGQIVWVELDPVVGREQGGRRPAVVVSSALFNDVVDTLAWVIPVSTVDRGWSNHVAIAGLRSPSWAMTEQLRTVSRTRLHGQLGMCSMDELAEIRTWIWRFLF